MTNHYIVSAGDVSTVGRPELLFALAAVLCFGACDGRAQESPRSISREEALDSALAFAAVHDAYLPWSTNPHSRRSFFSVDLEEELVLRGEPIALVAYLNDVWRSDAGHIAAFTESYWTYRRGTPYVVYELRVRPEMVPSLLTDRGEGRFDEHLVIAVIDHVSKQRFGVRAYSGIDQYEPIEFDAEFPEFFVARGSLEYVEFRPGGLRRLGSGR